MKRGFDLILNSLEKDLNEKLTAAMFSIVFLVWLILFVSYM